VRDSERWTINECGWIRPREGRTPSRRRGAAASGHRYHNLDYQNAEEVEENESTRIDDQEE
jgi:hypothetical protein